MGGDFASSPEMIQLKEQITLSKKNLVDAREGNSRNTEARIDFWTERMNSLIEIFQASVGTSG